MTASVISVFCSVIKSEENLEKGAGEMAQRLRALIVLPKDLGSIPSTYMDS